VLNSEVKTSDILCVMNVVTCIPGLYSDVNLYPTNHPIHILTLTTMVRHINADSLVFKRLLWKNLLSVADYIHQRVQTKTCGHFLPVKMAD
jgi:hypothetical protein